jgi:hypothetical protein
MAGAQHGIQPVDEKRRDDRENKYLHLDLPLILKWPPVTNARGPVKVNGNHPYIKLYLIFGVSSSLQSIGYPTLRR